MPRWDLVYKWADPEARTIVDAVTSALENCDRKLTEVEAGRAVQDDGLDVERLADALRLARSKGELTGTMGDWAVAIAAEYDRLRAASPLNASESPPTTEEGPYGPVRPFHDPAPLRFGRDYSLDDVKRVVGDASESCPEHDGSFKHCPKCKEASDVQRP